MILSTSPAAASSALRALHLLFCTAMQICVATEGVNLHAAWGLAAELVVPRPRSSGPAGLHDLEPLLDTRRLHTNDIAAILRTYGVEAARAAIVREIRTVFDVYGIAVDTRHLMLIADYMTYSEHCVPPTRFPVFRFTLPHSACCAGGGYRPMNRAGIEGHSSPLLRMSFETTAAFLTSALLRGEHERMTSASARIVLGRVVDSGTGCFDLWQPLPA
jgi:DNA-directed RNA polymerase I subunit RPA1